MEEELAALGDVWHHTFSYISSMSLKCAVELRIPDAVHSHGGSITLPGLAAALSVPPSRILPLRRLMRILVRTGCFAKQRLGDGGGDEEEGYSLTRLSALLVSSNPATVSPFVQGMLHPLLIDSWHSLGSWFRDDAGGSPPTPFAAAHGKRIFEAVRERPEFAAEFNAAMASDSRAVGELLAKHHADVFDGARSMVDVGGGTGALAAIIAEAFPHVKCTVQPGFRRRRHVRVHTIRRPSHSQVDSARLERRRIHKDIEAVQGGNSVQGTRRQSGGGRYSSQGRGSGGVAVLLRHADDDGQRRNAARRARVEENLRRSWLLGVQDQSSGSPVADRALSVTPTPHEKKNDDVMLSKKYLNGRTKIK